MKKSILFLFAAFTFAACSDDDETLTVERIADDYQPNTVGSTWDYTSGLFDYTYTITKNAKKLGGKTYFQIKVTIPDAGSFNMYMRKEGNSYFTRELGKGFYDDGEYIFLKDAEEGTTWTELTYMVEVDGVQLETTETLTIIETGGTYVVNETTFTDVIVVKVSGLTEGSDSPSVLYKYYAKGVGEIKVEDDDEFASTELLSHSIAE